MIPCIIIEDDPIQALDMKIMAEEIGLIVKSVITNYKDIEEILISQKVDIILSDIKIGFGINSYDILSKLEKLPPIIFFSNYTDLKHYEESKAVRPYIYLTKPVDELTLRSSVEGALKMNVVVPKKGGDIHREEDIVFIRSKGKLIPINFLNVQFVFAKGNYCIIHLEDKKIVIRSSIKSVKEKFNNPFFIQIHRSYLININFVDKINIGEGIVDMQNVSLPISRKFKKDLISISL